MDASQAIVLFGIAACIFSGEMAMASDDGARIPDQSGGTVVIPPSSIPNPGDAGKAGHTNVQIYYPPQAAPQPPEPPRPSPDGKPNK
jgi:hypothetical protein